VARGTWDIADLELTETGRRYQQANDVVPRRRLLRWAVLTVAGLGFFFLFGLFLLGFADFEMAGNGSPDAMARVEWVWAHGDHLHFAVHIIQARVYDLCPCTRRTAAAEYYYAHFHALTPHQKAIVANARPASFTQWVEYVTGPFVVSLDWAHDGLSWLGGQRPTQQESVLIDQYEFQPAEIQIPRGTTVTWRNVDELGEAHTVTADPGQVEKFRSDYLEPDETFEHTFTERGIYVYYCEAHGQPGHEGMSGVVIVQ